MVIGGVSVLWELHCILPSVTNHSVTDKQSRALLLKGLTISSLPVLPLATWQSRAWPDAIALVKSNYSQK